MGDVVYELPREKLQSQGVKHLLLPELLQVIIGSGNAHSSGARLARRIADLFAKNSVTYTSLIKVDGIGHARASQVLAAIELGRRVEQGLISNRHKSLSLDILQPLITRFGKYTYLYLYIICTDGAGAVVAEIGHVVANQRGEATILRQISSEIIIAKARNVTIIVGDRRQAYLPSPDQLRVKGYLERSFRALSVDVKGWYIASRKQIKPWPKY